MALKITKSSEPIEVKTITTCIYAQPGIGKSTLAFTAEKPLLLDFDRGSYRARNRKDVVQIEKWADVTNITTEDLAPYKTIVVDTAGRALDFLAVDVIAGDAKLGRGGALTLQGFGVLKTKFVAWTNLMRSFGLDVVLIAHMDEQGKGDEVKERLDIQGGSKGEVYKCADLMGRIYLTNGKRTLNFNPTDTAFGKNPAQLEVIEVPDYALSPDTLATVIARTKKALNELSVDQMKAAAAYAEWSEQIAKLVTVEEFNATIAPARASDESVRDNVKRLLVKVAKEKGFAWDGKAGAFVAPQPKPGDKPAEAPAVPEGAGVVLGAIMGSAAAIAAESPPVEREPGSDDGEEANRKAAEPTAAELEKMGPAPAPRAAKKGKAA